MNVHHTWTSRRTMGTAIGGSVGLLAVLLGFGWRDRAWTVAAGVLLLACLAVCVWTVAQGRRAERDVDLAIERLAAARRADERRRSTRSGRAEHE